MACVKSFLARNGVRVEIWDDCFRDITKEEMEQIHDEIQRFAWEQAVRIQGKRETQAKD